MKIAMPLMLAWYFHKYESVLQLRHFAIAALILLLPIAFILKQPDLGTSLLVGAAGFFVIFFAGLPWKFMFGLGAACAAASSACRRETFSSRVSSLTGTVLGNLGLGFGVAVTGMGLAPGVLGVVIKL
jgi:rod shape determining protein RodA